MWLANDLVTAKEYANKRNFTEPLFVFAIMVVAGSKPILHFATQLLYKLGKGLQFILRTKQAPTLYFLTLSITPLLGSLITEPAAMTLAAFLFAGPSLSPQMFYSAFIWHPWCVIRQYLHWRHAHQFCGTTHTHGGVDLGLEYGLHVCEFWPRGNDCHFY